MSQRTLFSVLRARPSVVLHRAAAPALTTPIRFSSSDAHNQETFEQFSERYVAFFQGAQDLFEVQRGLNNCFAHDLVPSPSVVEAALRAARRVNDYATAVRVFEGVREKVENKQQYQAYLDELKPVREELGGYSLACICRFFSDSHLLRAYRHRHERRSLPLIKLCQRSLFHVSQPY
jgi:cytochrome c oxidase subunit 5a